MNMDEINQQLAKLANSGDATFAQAAQYIGSLIQQVQTGQLSKEDMAELLKDMQRQLDIVQEMSQMAFKETLNTCINGLITLAFMAY
jgi:hypothetical protein